MVYAGKPAEVLTFDVLGSCDEYLYNDIETSFSSEYITEHCGDVIKADTKKTGNRLAWYCYGPENSPAVISQVHAALTFARYFFRPTNDYYALRQASKSSIYFVVSLIDIRT